MSSRSRNIWRLHGKGAAASTAAAAFAVASAVALSVPTAARAQGLLLGADPLAGHSTTKRAFDILRGQDKPGPYILSWNTLRLTTNDTPPVVNVDGKNLTPDAYTFDTAKGTITFRDPLKAASMARVEYNYDTIFSHPNPGASATAAPVTLSLTQLGIGSGMGLQLTAVTGAAAGGSADTAKLVWGLGGKSHLLGGGLTSQLYFGDGASGKSGFLDRTGMKLAYTTGNTNNGLDASFNRAGSGFAPATGKALGMGDAKQDWSLGTRLRPANWLGTTYQIGGNQSLLGGGSASQNAFGLKLGGARAVDPTLNFQTTSNSQVDGKGNHLDINSDKADFASKLAPTLGLSAKMELTQTDATDKNKDGTVQETALAFASKNAKGNITQANLSITDGLKRTAGGLETHQGVALQLQPAQTLTLAVAQNDKQTDATGAAAPVTNEETTFSLASKNAKGNITQASLAVVDGVQKASDAVQTHQAVTVKLQPAAKVTLTLGQDDRATDPTDTDAASSAATKTTVAQTIVGAEITPAPNTKLSTSLQQSTKNDVKTQATNVDAQFGLGKTVAVTGGITNRESTQGGIADLDTTRVGLSIQTAPGVSLTTGMVVNPVDKNGLVNQAQQQNLGLTLKQGAWEVGSGYSVTTRLGAAASDPKGLPTQTGEMSFTLGLRLSPIAKLSWGYKNAFQCGNTNPTVSIAPRGLEAYTLSYTQNLGDRLNLSLGGSLTDDKSKINQPQDIKAQAKLGMRF